MINSVIDPSDKPVMVGKSEAAVGLSLHFPGFAEGKYRLVFEIMDAGLTKAATAQTDVELVQQ